MTTAARSPIVERAAAAIARMSMAALLSLLMFVFVAGFSLYQRSEFFGKLGLEHHQWLTGSTLKFVDNWKHDGLWNDRALMLEYPRSIERPTLTSRGIYPSYLSGAALEIFTVSQIVPFASTLQVIHAFNLANQIAVAALIVFIVLRLSQDPDGIYRYMFATIASFIYLMHPTPYYHHFLVFFADQAVMLPFAGVLALEAAIRSRVAPATRLRAVQALLLGSAAFIDWLAFSLAAMLFLFRVIRPLASLRREPRRVIMGRESLHLAGPLAAIAVLLIQAWSAGELEILRVKFLSRTGLGGEPFPDLWGFFIVTLGRTETSLVLVGSAVAVVLLFVEDAAEAATVSLIGFGTCLLHTLLLSDHSVSHDFAALKFFLPLSYAGFGLLPIVAINFIQRASSVTTRLSAGDRQLFFRPFAWRVELFTKRLGYIRLLDPAICLSLLMAVWMSEYVYSHRNWRANFYSQMRLADEEIVRWLGQHARFEDVFVGRNYRIDFQPPQAMAVSRKAVYQFKTVEDLNKFFRQNSRATFYGIVASQDAGCLAGSQRLVTLNSDGTEWVIARLAEPLAAVAPCLVSTEDYLTHEPKAASPGPK